MWDWGIHPLFSWIGRGVFGAASGMYQHFIDGLFTDAASDAAYRVNFETFEITTIGLFILPSMFFAAYLLGTRAGKKAWVRDEKIAAAGGTVKPPQMPRWLEPLLLVFIVFFIPINLLTIWSRWFSVEAAVGFEQHMQVITPVISDQDAKVLWSRWAGMKTEEDYRQIYLSIDGVARAHAIVLPKVGVYSLVGPS